jgi:hypothetical protein
MGRKLTKKRKVKKLYSAGQRQREQKVLRRRDIGLARWYLEEQKDAALSILRSAGVYRVLRRRGASPRVLKKWKTDVRARLALEDTGTRALRKSLEAE